MRIRRRTLKYYWIYRYENIIFTASNADFDAIMTETEQLQQEIRDYSLVGEESGLSVERGLANATWYTSPVPKEKMRELQVRRNGPAIWDTLLWFGLIFGSAFLVIWLWGTWWFLLPYFVYTVLYATTSDSRWHESSHGTAFKSGWMNNTLYEIASFMVFRQSIVWRWSHTRHHSDTLVRGRDPEIAAPRPPDIRKIILNMFALGQVGNIGRCQQTFDNEQIGFFTGLQHGYQTEIGVWR